MGKVSEYGTSNGIYMHFQKHLENYPNQQEVRTFTRAQEIMQMATNASKSPEEIDAILVKEFGSVEKAIEMFESAKANITKNWKPEAQRTNGSFGGLVQHAVTKDGIDLRKMEAQEGKYGYNGGRGCDVSSGPCSCGAWH